MLWCRGVAPSFTCTIVSSANWIWFRRIIGRQEKSLERCVASPDGRTLAFCGNDGYVILFDAHTKSWMTDFKMNGSVRAIVFTNDDGNEVLASGSDGDVYRWDLRSRKCLERFSNQDGTITSSLGRVVSDACGRQ